MTGYRDVQVGRQTADSDDTKHNFQRSKSMLTRRTLLASASSAALLSSLAACGGSDEGSSTGTKLDPNAEATLTIPAGESVTVEAAFTKEGSYDFTCAHTENRGIYGYDLLTQLGSNLSCTQQTATLEDRGFIQIVRQNFGFDLEAGVNTVTLDPASEHYYLEVKRIAE